MLTRELIQHLHSLIEEFSNQTGALTLDFTENKKRAVWSLKYNIIKVEFVFTKKEKMLCPMHTLFCRVYLGKNENYFYHLPEIIQFLEPDNFQCYYYTYIDSGERLEACFTKLAAFLKSLECYKDKIPTQKNKIAAKLAASVRFIIILSLILR